ncbi:MAG: PA2169 family four-helix-bundle protein [Luteolibacter sp.]
MSFAKGKYMITFPPILEHFDRSQGELQPVLTRYVDSFDGYLRAAQLIDHSGYATAFVEIAARRKSIIAAVSKMIAGEDEAPDRSGSMEAQVHRWWMTVKAAMSDEELRVMLEECARGETELLRVINQTLENESGHLKAGQYQLLATVGAEVEMAIETFQQALKK